MTRPADADLGGDTLFLPDEELPAPRVRPAPKLARRRLEWGPLQIALAVSLLFHGLLLTVQLATPGSPPRQWVERQLDVILVNTRDSEAPVQAQAIAQASLRGGGDGAPGERAQSPLPPAESLSLGEAAEDTQRRVQALQAQQQELLNLLRRELARLPPPQPELESSSREGQAQAEQRRLLLTQMAELERRINEQNAPPRQRYVSPATQEAAYALYYDQLRQRIEQRGTRDFPSAGGRKLYGALTMNISVGLQGEVLGTDVVEPSGTPGLDERAVAIVRAAAPFGRFSEAMRAEAEVLVLSARFSFDRDKGVQATLQANANANANANGSPSP